MKYKKLIFLIILMIATRTDSIAQKTLSIIKAEPLDQNVTGYFLLDSVLQKGPKFNHIKCIDKYYKAELFNVFYDEDSTLVNFTRQISLFTLFTALPDYKSQKPEWREVNLKEINQKLISVDSLRREFRRQFTKFRNSRGDLSEGAKLKSEKIKPIIKIGNKYYTPSSPTIMEHFAVVKITGPLGYITNAFPNLNQFFEINLDAPIFTIAQFEKNYMDKFKHPSFNSGGGVDRYNSHYI